MSIVERLSSLASNLLTSDRQHLAEDHAALEQHFRFEEQEVWPEFAASSAAARSEVSALLAEHARIRETLDRLGIEIQLKRVDREAIERLIEQLRAHARHENELFYPWTRASA